MPMPREAHRGPPTAAHGPREIDIAPGAHEHIRARYPVTFRASVDARLDAAKELAWSRLRHPGKAAETRRFSFAGGKGGQRSSRPRQRLPSTIRTVAADRSIDAASIDDPADD